MLTALRGSTGLAGWRSVPVEHCSDDARPGAALAGLLWPGGVGLLMLTALSALPGLAGWRSVPVEHCSDAHGLVLRLPACSGQVELGC